MIVTSNEWASRCILAVCYVLLQGRMYVTPFFAELCTRIVRLQSLFHRNSTSNRNVRPVQLHRRCAPFTTHTGNLLQQCKTTRTRTKKGLSALNRVAGRGARQRGRCNGRRAAQCAPPSCGERACAGRRSGRSGGPAPRATWGRSPSPPACTPCSSAPARGRSPADVSWESSAVLLSDIRTGLSSCCQINSWCRLLPN